MEKVLTTVLSRLVKRGALTIVTARGNEVTLGDGTGESVRIRFMDAGAERAIVLNPELRLGELFMDGRVVMEIDVEKSETGPESEGIPISVLATGQVIRSPRINTTTAQTTVSALPGRTIVVGGLILDEKKAELVILLTPHVGH